jgi:hypothetical protein
MQTSLILHSLHFVVATSAWCGHMQLCVFLPFMQESAASGAICSGA